MDRRALRELSSRIDALLGDVHDNAEPAVATRVEDLVRSVVAFYGAGFERTLTVLEEAGASGLIRELADDEVVGSLLMLHDLHPDSVEVRVQQALDAVRPYLGSHAGGVDFQGVDEEGVVHLSLQGSCDGCPSSLVTVKTAIESAVLDAAPEVVAVEVEGMVEEGPKLLQIGRAPHLDEPGAGAGEPDDAGEDAWRHMELSVPPGEVSAMTVDGAAVLVCNVRGTMYAYRDQCSGCGAGLGDGTLRGEVLRCAGCGRSFDVRLAGQGLDGASEHLAALPLLPENAAWKLALPRRLPA